MNGSEGSDSNGGLLGSPSPPGLCPSPAPAWAGLQQSQEERTRTGRHFR